MRFIKIVIINKKKKIYKYLYIDINIIKNFIR